MSRSNWNELNPFFRNAYVDEEPPSAAPIPASLSTSSSPATVYSSGDRAMRTLPPEPPVHDSFMFARMHNTFLDHLERNNLLRGFPTSPRQPEAPPQRRSEISILYPLDPPSPTYSEEVTPPRTPERSPSPARSPVPDVKEKEDPPPPPSTPIGGIPAEWKGRAEDNITMGFAFAESWKDTLKDRRLGLDAEERMELPRIFRRVPKRKLYMMVAHKNVDATVFHTVEVSYKTEKTIRAALAKHFNLPEPRHRIRFSVSKWAELPLNQQMIENFEGVEYFRLDTRCSRYWVLHHIINCLTENTDYRPVKRRTFKVVKPE